MKLHSWLNMLLGFDVEKDVRRIDELATLTLLAYSNMDDTQKREFWNCLHNANLSGVDLTSLNTNKEASK
jgi:hypothetical protein